jgi:catechol 2,3-dioxygenase-like lactoylglutathione lyase family enzyme
MDLALDFYRDRLCFPVVDDSIVKGDIIKSISHGKCDTARLVLMRISKIGAMLELQELMPDSELAQESLSTSIPTGLISILVADLEAHVARAKAKNLYPTSDVFTVELPRQGKCKVIFYTDPDGHRLEFLEVFR